ncbi:hypothetical protein O1611_g2041 [Lasiodiplodia mahajangana]|uniref:Uncharacterized protein n=1 Tax=Lasiodiplodia mahajangana TaxID=1108764 RepID=A0ACC2JVN3_9PEZI|nr:hypothetical protein O1611_g2041 [Lasiodiplodia mahajangana]
MADVYTPVADFSYLLLRPFYAPTDKGAVWAIAVSTNSGALITAALSVVFLVIFMCLWNLACFIALLCPGKGTRSRYAALVTIWNSNDAWFAFRELVKYTIHFRSNKGNLAYGLTFATCALVIFGGSLVLGIIGPSLIQINNVAPVRPSIVYYPVQPTLNNPTDLLKDFGLRAPSFLRALGSVEAAQVTKRNRVKLNDVPYLPPWNGTEPVSQLNYGYNITGSELGLQHGADLKLEVTGSCTTEYGWLDPRQDNSTDLYYLWGLNRHDINFSVPIDNISIQNAPKASFLYHPDAPKQYLDSGNSSFAIFAWSAHRASISTSSDPWYATENGSPGYNTPYQAKFWVKRGRPALSCWQHDQWTYKRQAVKTVIDLKDLPGMKIPQVLLNVLVRVLATPMLVTLGNASGDTALRSRTTSPNGVIDASASSIKSDLERLLVASFVATRNIFVDATMFASSDKLGNIFQGANGQPEDGAGDFVVTSPSIQTFSLVGIIVLFVVLVALLLIGSIISFVIHLNHPQKSGQNAKDNPWIRYKVLSATQLFRCIYEAKEFSNDTWPCDTHLPVSVNEDDKKDPKVGLRGCNNKQRCKGHIDISESVKEDQVGNTNTAG